MLELRAASFTPPSQPGSRHMPAISKILRKLEVSWSNTRTESLLGRAASPGKRRGGNLSIVMLIGGLWHGAAWNFVIWGALHGALLAFERVRGKAALYARLPSPVRIAATFAIVLITWVFFRSRDLPHAVRYLSHMLAVGGVQDGAGLLAGIVYQPYYLGTLLLAAAIVWGAPQTWDWTRTLTLPKAAATLALLAVSAMVLATQAYNPFIYFIF